LKLKFQTVAAKTAKNFRGLLYFAAPGRPVLRTRYSALNKPGYQSTLIFLVPETLRPRGLFRVDTNTVQNSTKDCRAAVNDP